MEEAIFDAVLDELAEGGFARLTFEGVAARARTGKSALYRRWPNKTELVIETMNNRAPDASDFVETGMLREDLIRLVHHMTRGLDGPAGIALRSLIGEAHHSPELLTSLTTRFIDPRINSIESVLVSAAARGEIDYSRVTREVIEAIPALVLQRYLLHPGPITSKFGVAMVDRVLIPIVKPGFSALEH